MTIAQNPQLPCETARQRLSRERFERFREARVARAAHLFRNFEAWRAREFCEEEGISGAEIREGAELGDQARREYRTAVSICGDPAYGSWGVFGKPPAMPVQDLLTIWALGPFCTSCLTRQETVAYLREAGPDKAAACCDGGGE